MLGWWVTRQHFKNVGGRRSFEKLWLHPHMYSTTPFPLEDMQAPISDLISSVESGVFLAPNLLKMMLKRGFLKKKMKCCMTPASLLVGV